MFQMIGTHEKIFIDKLVVTMSKEIEFVLRMVSSLILGYG